MEQYGVGQPVRRREDVRFLNGTGRYLDDVDVPSQLHAVFLRSPHAHATIRSIDAAGALRMPGVEAVFTAADLDRTGVGVVPTRTPAKNSDGSPVPVPPWSALASGRVRFVGEAVAMVVATTRMLAIDALERVQVDYETLPAVVDGVDALRADASVIWSDVGTNLCVDFSAGDQDATEAALAAADHVVSLELNNQRVVAVPIEPRGAIGEWNAESNRHRLICTTQNLHANRRQIAEDMLGIESDDLRLVAYDVGGGFGVKNPMYPEYTLVLFASRELNKPVKWTNDRTESFSSDCHGRDQRSVVRLGLTKEGRFVALDVESIGNVGPYVMSVGPFTPTGGSARTQGGAYRFDEIHFHSRAAFTNTTPTDPYRGAGRPEASYQIERIIDFAAAQLDMDAIELRRINAFTSDDMPYTTRVGAKIDSGNCRAVLDRALGKAAWDRFEGRAAYSHSKGLYRGIGVGLYMECGGGAPKEHAIVSVLDDGRVQVAVGSQSTGMGHETAFSQLLAHRLGLPIESIVYLQGDTDLTPTGGGHGGSRGLEMGGGAVLDAAEVFIEKLKEHASSHLETATADIVFEQGGFVVAGTDRAVPVKTLLTTLTADQPQVLPDLSSSAEPEREEVTFPNGCHICEVEVDADTGRIALKSYHIVDDFGVIVNPLTAAGQVMGGTVQGIGQAMLEQICYDDTGQLVTGSLMDYCLPRADDLSDIDVDFYPGAPTMRNPLGVKGSGEAGCCGALPALVNAVVNALDGLGVRHIEMPLTPEKVWRAIQQAQHPQ